MTDEITSGHGRVKGFSVRVTLTNGFETRAAYNAEDRTGEHNVFAPHDRHYRTLTKEQKQAIAEAYSIAKKDAIDCQNYKDERRHDTTQENLRYAWLIRLHLAGGYSIYYDQNRDSTNCTLTGYNPRDVDIAEANRLGIPIIDSRNMEWDKLYKVAMAGPMPPLKPGHDDGPNRERYTSLHHAPLEIYAALWAAMGAAVSNIKYDINDAQRCAGMTAIEAQTLFAYIKGDEAALFEAILNAPAN